MAGHLLRRTHVPTHATRPDQDHCSDHQFEPAVDVCRQCRRPCCHECVVYAFGADQPPYCLPCAMRAAGVRGR